MTQDIALIVKELSLGHVVALPTETVYGLAANAMHESAIKKVFSIKGRPLTHPLIMHVADHWDLSPWVKYIPPYAYALMQRYWPGPLTLVFHLNLAASLSPLITGGQNTIAIRCPNHPKTLQVLRELGQPIVMPSANPFGKISPTQAIHVYQDFPESDFLILEGGRCEVGIESTILDASVKDKAQILRQGRVTARDLQDFVQLYQTNSTMKVSGCLKHHYQPDKPLYYFDASHLDKISAELLKSSSVLIFSTAFELNVPHLFVFSSCSNQAEAAFYSELRHADTKDVKQILIELPPDSFAWQGLRDRIKRAGQSLKR